jgi:23S rRNA pseudouridine1911/1915/1917 synthase
LKFLFEDSRNSVLYAQRIRRRAQKAGPLGEFIRRGAHDGVIHWRSKGPGALLPRLRESLGQSAPSIERLRELLALGALYSEKERLLDWSYLECEHPGPTYLRLHTEPRRYDLSVLRDWQERVVFENENFLIFNKPSGLPCHPMVDNFQENLLVELQRLTGKKLLLTHRLDRATKGLLLLAKTLEYQKAFNHLLTVRGVQKLYRAAVESAPPWLEGQELTHYMLPSPRAPKLLVREMQLGTQECRLRILKIDNCLLTLELLTGRTHQIRAQLGFEGFPICGDVAYGASHQPWGEENIALQSFQLAFRDPLIEQNWSFELPFLKMTH